MSIDYILGILTVLIGIVIMRIGRLIKAHWEWKRYSKKREQDQIQYLQRKKKEVDEFLDWNDWMLTGGVSVPDLRYHLFYEMSDDDRENFAHAMEAVQRVIKGEMNPKTDMSELITLVDIDDAGFRPTLKIAILPSAVPDTDERNRMTVTIDNQVREGILQTYGEVGLSRLNTGFDFVMILEDEK